MGEIALRKAGRRARVNWRFGAGVKRGRWAKVGQATSNPLLPIPVFVDTETMEIVFDESKRQQNRAKHGYDFADFERCFDRDTALALPTRPSRTGRARYLFVGR